MKITHLNHTAVICRHAITGEWIYCFAFGNMIESDELAKRNHGTFATKQTAISSFRKEAEWLAQ